MYTVFFDVGGQEFFLKVGGQSFFTDALGRWSFFKVKWGVRLFMGKNFYTRFAHFKGSGAFWRANIFSRFSMKNLDLRPEPEKFFLLIRKLNFRRDKTFSPKVVDKNKIFWGDKNFR